MGCPKHNYIDAKCTECVSPNTVRPFYDLVGCKDHVGHPQVGCYNCRVVPKEDCINHPSHYNNHPSGVECIEITRHANFNLGNAIKYIWRVMWPGKKHNPIEDLEKAIFYLREEVKCRTAKRK